MQISKVDAAIEHAVSEIAKTDAMIAQVRDEYLQLTVASPQDQDGYKSAEVALKKVVRMRTSVEKTRKELKADSVRYGKAVDAEARRIREQIEPIEEHLKTQCDVVRLEEARQKVAAENARRDEVAGWVAELSALGWPVDLPALQRMTADEFGFVRLSAKKRLDEQAAERESIAKERAALEAERLELEELRAEKARREAVEPSPETLGYIPPDPTWEIKGGWNRPDLSHKPNTIPVAATIQDSLIVEPTEEQLLLVCDALLAIANKLPVSLGQHRQRVKMILSEAIKDVRDLA